MNLLCLCDSNSAIEIIKKVKADNYYFIYADQKDSKEEEFLSLIKKMKNVTIYRYLEIVQGEIYLNLDWNTIPPLSRNTIEAMSYCETETFLQYERIDKIKNNHLYDIRKKIYMDDLRYWCYIIDSCKISLFYRNGMPHEGFDNIIYYLCKIKKIPTFLFNIFQPDLGYLATEVRDHFPRIKKEIAILQKEFKDVSEDKIKLNPILKKIADEHWLKQKPSILPVVIPESKKKLNKKRFKTYSSFIEYYRQHCIKPNLNQSYILFPLHYQYEATTNPMAGAFANQFLISEILSKTNLPIYIREHPYFSKNRSIEYYETLLKMKNINFISSDEDIYELIDNAFAIATATGTVGWEAIMRKKPVLMFGYTYYQYSSGVYQIDNLQECMRAIKHIETKFIPNKKNIYIFLKALEKYLFYHAFLTDPFSITTLVEALNKNIIEEGIC